MVARHRPGSVEDRAPGRVVALAELARRPRRVGLVAERGDRPGSRLEQLGGRRVAGRRARRDVTGGKEGDRPLLGARRCGRAVRRRRPGRRCRRVEGRGRGFGGSCRRARPARVAHEQHADGDDQDAGGDPEDEGRAAAQHSASVASGTAGLASQAGAERRRSPAISSSNLINVSDAGRVIRAWTT